MAWSTTPIHKTYSLSNLADVLSQGLLGSMSRHSHYQIIQWCADFSLNFDKQADDQIAISPRNALFLAEEVVVQWELYLAQQYSLEDLKRFSYDDFVLPKTYFETWLNELLNLQPA